VALTVVLCNSGTNGYWGVLKKTDLGTNVGFGHDAENDGKRVFSSYATASEQQTCCAQVIMEPNEYLYIVKNDTNTLETEDEKGMITMTATPLVNDVVLLNSQDEIFTDWVSYTPTWENSPTITNQQAWWRRNGPNLEIKGRMQMGSAPADTMALSLPSGLSIDVSKIGGEGADDVYFPSRFLRATNTVKYNDAGSNSSGLFFDKSQSIRTTYLFVGSNYNGQSGNCIDNTNYNSFGGSGDGIEFYAHGIPISGWTSTFNPVLSMPLVNVGTDWEYYRAGGGNANTNSPYFSNVYDNTSSALFSVINDSTDGFRVTALQRCHIQAGFTFSANCDTDAGRAGWVLNDTGTDAITAVSAANVLATSQSNYFQTESQEVSATRIMETGDTLEIRTENKFCNSALWKVNVTAQKDRGNTNMAHIIKPAVALLQDVKAYNVGGGTPTQNAWNIRNLNTISGESWFVTGTFSGIGTTNTNFTLESGTYEIFASAPAYVANRNMLGLNDVTGGNNILFYGSTDYSGTDTCNVASLHIPSFTITSSTEFNLQHEISNYDGGGVGLGVESDLAGFNSIFAQVKIRKLK
jgi:hypothetical protein